MTHARLSDGAATALHGTVQQRIDWVHRDYFIAHGSVRGALRWMSYCRRREAGRGRPRNVHVIGAAGAGKTELLRYYAAQQPVSPRQMTTGERPYPVIFVEVPPPGHCRDLCLALIRCCYPDFQPSTRFSIVDQCDRVLLQSGVRQILIDEAWHILLGGPRAQQVGLALWKRLTNRGMSLVIATPPNLRHVLAADDQLRSRFVPCELPEWTESDEFRDFLASIEHELPFEKPSRLSERRAVRWFVSHGILVTGRIVTTVRDAAVIALTRGQPCLSLDLLEQAREQHSAPDQGPEVP